MTEERIGCVVAVTMDRRELLKLIVAGGAGCLAGGWGAAALARRRVSLPVPVGPLPGLESGALRLFDDPPVALLRTGDGIAIVSLACTHLGCRVRLAGSELVCPCHGGRFSREGKRLGGPPPSDLGWLEGGVAPDGTVYCYPDRANEGSKIIKVPG